MPPLHIAGKRVLRGANVRFDEESWGGRESAGQEKPAPENIDPFQTTPDWEGSGSMAIDDRSKGKFATGIPLAPGIIDGGPIAKEGKGTSKITPQETGTPWTEGRIWHA